MDLQKKPGKFILLTGAEKRSFKADEEAVLNNTQQHEIAEILGKITLPEKMEFLYSSDSPLDKPVHGMPRLNLLLDKSLDFQLYEKGKFFSRQLDAPAFYYCSASGYQWANDSEERARQAVSFCYFKEYIRVVIFNSADDILYYHSPSPLSAGGSKLLEALEHLHSESAPPAVLLSLMKSLFTVTVQQLREHQGEYAPRFSFSWGRINAYLRAHREEDLSREKVAALFHISPGSLSRLAKKNTGMEYSKVRLLYKLELADELLRSTELTTDEIASRCGFNYTSYFYRCFYKHFGITPRKRRETLREEGSLA